MTESELRAVPPFDVLPLVPEAAGGYLRWPTGSEYHADVYEIGDVAVVEGLENDRQLVPVGGMRDASRQVRAIFWRLRTASPPT